MMLSLRFSIISITIVRLLFVFDIFSFNRILHYRINQIVIQSALINPIYTVDHIIEANAIRQLKNNNNNNNKYKYNTRNEHQQNQHDRKLSFLPNKSFWKAYEGNQIHLPPIMLSFMELIIHPIMLITSDYWFQVIIKFLVTFVDLLIAYQLESMARKLIQYEDNIDTRETIIMKQMDSRILPEYMSLFPNVSSMNDHHLSYVPDHDDHEDITGYNKTTKENAIDVNEETEEKQLEENEDETSNGMQEPFFILFRHEIPFVIAQMYYMNPTSILSSSCIGSFQNLRVLLLVSSLNQSIITYNNNDGGSVTFAVFLLAIASYIDIHLIIFILPVIFFIHKTTRRKINVHDKQQQPDQIQEHVELKKQQNQTQSNNPFNDWRVVLLLFALYYISFHIMSYRLVGGRIWKDVFVSTHLYSFQLNGSEPNLSTLWYLGMELFNRFRLYFTILLGGIPYTLIIPITIRFYNYPAVLMAIFWMMGVLFRPPSTLYELNVGICFMMYSSRSLMRIPKLIFLISIFALPIPVLLYMVSYWMWIGPNSGEANFLYFQCLAYNVFITLILLVFTSASLKRDKAIRVTEKMIRVEQNTITATDSDGVADKKTS